MSIKKGKNIYLIVLYYMIKKFNTRKIQILEKVLEKVNIIVTFYSPLTA